MVRNVHRVERGMKARWATLLGSRLLLAESTTFFLSILHLTSRSRMVPEASLAHRWLPHTKGCSVEKGLLVEVTRADRRR